MPLGLRRLSDFDKALAVQDATSMESLPVPYRAMGVVGSLWIPIFLYIWEIPGEDPWIPTWPWVKTNGIPFWGRCTTHFVYFSGDWDVHWGYGILTHGHMFFLVNLLHRRHFTAAILKKTFYGKQCWSSMDSRPCTLQSQKKWKSTVPGAPTSYSCWLDLGAVAELEVSLFASQERFRSYQEVCKDIVAL